VISVILQDKDPEVTGILMEILAGDGTLGPIKAVAAWEEIRRAAAGQPNSVIVLSPDMFDADFEQVLRLNSDLPGVAFVQIVDEVDPSVLQKAMRHGVRDVVAVAQAEEELAVAIQRAHTLVEAETRPRSQADESRGKVITVFGTKGGTGKTTVATNLSILLQKDSSVVLVDANVSFGDCSAFLRVRPERNLLDLAGIPGDLDDLVLAGVLTEHESGLQLLCSANDPLGVEKLEGSVITRAIKALRRSFDIVVVDTSSALDVFTEAALAECDVAYLVTSLELPAVKDAKVSLSTFERLNLGTEKIRIVLNRANTNVGFPPSEVGKALGKRIVAELPSDIAVPRSINTGTPVVTDAPKTNISKALGKLSQDVRKELWPAAQSEGGLSVLRHLRPKTAAP
jgi:pilus assembly protein CpaE